MRTAIVFDPLREIEQWQRQMESRWEDSTQARQPISHTYAQPRDRAWRPVMEFCDRPGEFLLRVELPGIEKKELDVQVSRTRVAIAGQRDPNPERAERRNVRSELRYGKFHRVVELPKPVVSDRVTAELKNGILTLTLPKLEAQQPKVVKVQVAGADSTPSRETPVVDATPKVEPTPAPEPENTPDLEVTEDLWATPA